MNLVDQVRMLEERNEDLEFSNVNLKKLLESFRQMLMRDNVHSLPCILSVTISFGGGEVILEPVYGDAQSKLNVRWRYTSGDKT